VPQHECCGTARFPRVVVAHPLGTPYADALALLHQTLLIFT
jgi:hypothetical protein